MGVDLINDAGEEFQFRNAGWKFLLEFAESAGFIWPCNETGEALDRLSADQAALLADAIEKGVGTRSDAEAAKHASEVLTDRLVIPSKSPLFRNDPIVIDEKGIRYWRDFARFARLGGFNLS
jgi:hypothetical protein